MSQIQDSAITKDDIIDYIDTMKIKKSSFGGLDKVDVYVHIQELVKLYGMYAAQEVESYKEKVEQQEEDIAALRSGGASLGDGTEFEGLIETLKGENRELKKQNKNMDQKIQEQRQKIMDLHLSNSGDSSEVLEELERCKDYTQELIGQLEQCKIDQEKSQYQLEESQKEAKILKREVTELAEYKHRALRLQEELEKENSGTNIPIEVESYKETIFELQRDKQEQKRKIEELKGFEQLANQLQLEASHLKLEMAEIKKNGPYFSNDLQMELQKRNQDVMQLEEKLARQKTMSIVSQDENLKSSEVSSSQERYDQLMKKLESASTLNWEKRSNPINTYGTSDVERNLVPSDYSVTNKEQKIQSIMGQLESAIHNARKEGQLIAESARIEAESARIEAEREMIKLINLREKFQKESEEYHSWYNQVEFEKQSVKEFLKQLSNQYERINKEFLTTKERENTLDVKRMLGAMDNIHPAKYVELHYDEKKDLA